MSQANVIFNYKGIKTTVPCIKSEKIANIINRFSSKIQEDVTKLYFIYNGNLIDKELKFEEQANEMDMMSLNMNLIVEDMEKEELKENIIDSEEIICPKCNENIIIKIKNYKINTKCKNNHQLSLSFIEFKNSQKIDISKIKCYICNEKNQSNIYNKEMYKCITCNNNICPLCREKHDKNHIIINYEKRNLICYKHNDFYTKYCYDCKKNICMKCEKEHNNHNTIYFGTIINDDYTENEFNNLN